MVVPTRVMCSLSVLTLNGIHASNLLRFDTYYVESFFFFHGIAEVRAQLHAQVEVDNLGRKHKQEKFIELQIRGQVIRDAWCEIEPIFFFCFTVSALQNCAVAAIETSRTESL